MTKKSTMTDDHKAALAEGRRQGRAIRDYLEGLEATKPKRGRKRTPESIAARLASIEESLPSLSGVRRLEAIQERMDLTAELEAKESAIDMDSLTAAFVAHAGAYSERKGISYAAWREMGIDAAVLRDAGIKRSS